VATVGELTHAKDPDATVTVTEVATRLGVSVSSAWRRVHEAIAGKWLVNDEHRRSQTAKLRLGEPLPASSSLPTPEAVQELYVTGASEVVPGVFTFAPHPAVSGPLVGGGRQEGSRLSTVIAENPQTADLDPQMPDPAVPLNFGIFGDDDEEWGIGRA
jgi:hypothetical protein